MNKEKGLKLYWVLYTVSEQWMHKNLIETLFYCQRKKTARTTSYDHLLCDDQLQRPCKQATKP